MKKLIFLLFLLPSIIVFAPTSNYSYKDYFDHLDQLALEEFLFWERDRCIDDLRFTPELLIEYLYRLDIKSPHIVFNQAILETGWFTSNVFKENNNLFGMNHPYLRSTKSIKKSSKGFAVFTNWTESVKDYALWQDYKSQWHEQDDYYSFLVNVHYAEDPYYNNKLKRINTNIIQNENSYLFNAYSTTRPIQRI